MREARVEENFVVIAGERIRAAATHPAMQSAVKVLLRATRSQIHGGTASALKSHPGKMRSGCRTWSRKLRCERRAHHSAV